MQNRVSRPVIAHVMLVALLWSGRLAFALATNPVLVGHASFVESDGRLDSLLTEYRIRASIEIALKMESVPIVPERRLPLRALLLTTREPSDLAAALRENETGLFMIIEPQQIRIDTVTSDGTRRPLATVDRSENSVSHIGRTVAAELVGSKALKHPLEVATNTREILASPDRLSLGFAARVAKMQSRLKDIAREPSSDAMADLAATAAIHACYFARVNPVACAKWFGYALACSDYLLDSTDPIAGQLSREIHVLAARFLWGQEAPVVEHAILAEVSTLSAHENGDWESALNNYEIKSLFDLLLDVESTVSTPKGATARAVFVNGLADRNVAIEAGVVSSRSSRDDFEGLARLDRVFSRAENQAVAASEFIESIAAAGGWKDVLGSAWESISRDRDTTLLDERGLLAGEGITSTRNLYAMTFLVLADRLAQSKAAEDVDPSREWSLTIDEQLQDVFDFCIEIADDSRRRAKSLGHEDREAEAKRLLERVGTYRSYALQSFPSPNNFSAVDIPYWRHRELVEALAQRSLPGAELIVHELASEGKSACAALSPGEEVKPDCVESIAAAMDRVATMLRNDVWNPVLWRRYTSLPKDLSLDPTAGLSPQIVEDVVRRLFDRACDQFTRSGDYTMPRNARAQDRLGERLRSANKFSEQGRIRDAGQLIGRFMLETKGTRASSAQLDRWVSFMDFDDPAESISICTKTLEDFDWDDFAIGALQWEDELLTREPSTWSRLTAEGTMSARNYYACVHSRIRRGDFAAAAEIARKFHYSGGSGTSLMVAAIALSDIVSAEPPRQADLVRFETSLQTALGDSVMLVGERFLWFWTRAIEARIGRPEWWIEMKERLLAVQWEKLSDCSRKLRTHATTQELDSVMKKCVSIMREENRDTPAAKLLQKRASELCHVAAGRLLAVSTKQESNAYLDELSTIIWDHVRKSDASALQRVPAEVLSFAVHAAREGIDPEVAAKALQGVAKRVPREWTGDELIVALHSTSVAKLIIEYSVSASSDQPLRSVTVKVPPTQVLGRCAFDAGDFEVARKLGAYDAVFRSDIATLNLFFQDQREATRWIEENSLGKDWEDASRMYVSRRSPAGLNAEANRGSKAKVSRSVPSLSEILNERMP